MWNGDLKMIPRSVGLLSCTWIAFLAMSVSLVTGTSAGRGEVHAARAGESSAVTRVTASAEVIPVSESRVSTAISAPVEEILVKEGDAVIAGEPLVVLYSPDLELAVTAAELALKAAELDLVYWIPRLDRPPERRQQAEAETVQARMGLKTAQAEFAQATILAPYDATVVEVSVQPAEFVQAGQVLIVLGDLLHMRIQTTDLGERDVPLVREGQPADVFVEALGVNLGGRVIRVSPLAETVGGDVVFPVLIELDDQPGGLLWGMTAEVGIRVE
jgi:HlyD family secretion protein